MQSFDTKPAITHETTQRRTIITVGPVNDVPPGQCVTVELSDGSELALYNADGEFCATNNICPHKGAPLAEGIFHGHTIECDWHGWQFDVRTGRCLTTVGQVEVYRVFVEDGMIKIEV